VGFSGGVNWNLRVAIGFVGIFLQIFIGRIFRVAGLWSLAPRRGILIFPRIADIFHALARWTRSSVGFGHFVVVVAAFS
jgi:hypothetical protein